MQNQIFWNDYAGDNDFDAGPQLSQGDLNKALTAGNAIDSPGASTGEGFPHTQYL